MSYLIEEKLREAACLGDIESVQGLISQHVNINAQNRINGWSALHWACKRGHEDVVRVLLNNGADINLETNNAEKPASLCTHSNIAQLLGEPVAQPTSPHNNHLEAGDELKFVPNYIKNAPINGRVELNFMPRSAALPITSLPSNAVHSSANSIVLKVRVNGSCDPDFIEIELPTDKLWFSALMDLCCEELGVSASQVERIRKLPNTRLRNDNDVGRLVNFQELEVVLKGPGLDKFNNSYQSISSC